ncbi:MAG: hypothetical protein JWO86_3553 [Myxococcaceae bacterium]|nr:hypothetical protein [Myxococcaceae bacterium]
MGRMSSRGSRGYARTVGAAVATFAACGALVACTVETTTIERHVAPTDPAAADPSASDPTNGDAPGGARSGTSGSAGTSGTSGTSGSSGASGTSGTSGTSGSTKDAGADASSGGTSGTSGGTGAGGFDQFQIRNLADINQYRATKNLAPLVLSKTLSTFAMSGTQMLIMDHTPHHHFINAGNDGSLWNSGFQGGAAENQGDPNGWNKLANDPVQNELLQIDSIQKAMFDEGPGTGEPHGHYMNMMNPAYHTVGIGLVMVGTSLYLTNDFSD